MKLNFNLSELNISGEPIPEKVADKMLHWHILPMQLVRNEINIKITASLKSGYRSPEWEKSKNRNGKSQHCFGQTLAGTNRRDELGAVDWTCEDFAKNKNKFLESIIKNTPYRRIAIYETFIHCDYKPTPSGLVEIYKSDQYSKWELIRCIEE